MHVDVGIMNVFQASFRFAVAQSLYHQPPFLLGTVTTRPGVIVLIIGGEREAIVVYGQGIS